MNNCLYCKKIIKPRKYVKYEFLKYCNTTCNEKFRINSYREYSKYKKENCEKCGAKESDSEYWFNKRLTIHHIDENPSNNKNSNLKTLCRRCHSIEHTKKENHSLTHV